MRNPRAYILHEDQRVYTDGAPVCYEFSCAQCGEEVPESGMYTLSGEVCAPGRRASLGPNPDLPARSTYLHESCVMRFVGERLAQVRKT